MYCKFNILSAFFILLSPVILCAFDSLPDTGVVKCYNNLAEIPCPAEGEPFYGQDANYQDSINSNFQDNADGTVTDLATGLKWDKADDGTTRNWQDAFDYCINRNARLPTWFQLETIVDYTRNGPAINTVFSAQSNGEYWSRNYIENPFGTDFAWSIEFFAGQGGKYYDKDQPLFVRCVRNEWETGLGPYRDNNNGTVTDMDTGKTWQAAEGSLKTWEEALAHCEGQNLAGKSWRLPNIRELRSIVRTTETWPAIDTDYFQAVNDAYWSSTTAATAANIAWTVDFKEGKATTTDGSKSQLHYVRCVDHGDPSQYKLSFRFDIGVGELFKATSDPIGIDCGQDCEEYFDAGTEVTLTISHELWQEFKCNWSAPCGRGKTCFVVMDAPRDISADCYGFDKTSIEGSINLLMLLGN